MDRPQDGKLVEYLSNMTIYELLELWVKVDDDFLSPDEYGIADHMVYTLGVDKILDALAAPLVEQLVSEDTWDQQEALNAMQKMGYDMTKLGTSDNS